MMILEADLPVLPGEGVDNLLLGALLSAYLQSLIFTDGHTSANENNIALDRFRGSNPAKQPLTNDKDFSLC